MDEPTLDLDVQTRAAIWSYIRRLKDEYNMTIFLTTHYMEEADSLCDRIAIIDHGRVLKIGSPIELKIVFILIMSLVQPFIWLALFGRAMNISTIFTGGSFNIPGLNIPKEIINRISRQIMEFTFGTSDYFASLVIEMLSFIAQFTAMFSGMSITWDRRLFSW